MKLSAINNPDREWDIFINKYSPFIYHCSLWADVLKEGFNGEILYFVLHKKGKIVAGLPGFIMKKIFIKIYFSSIPFGGFIGEKKYFPFLKEEIEKYLTAKGIHQIRISDSLIYNNEELDDYKKEELVRIVLDLKKYRKRGGRKSLSQSIKWSINRGLKLGARTVEIKQRDEVEDLYKLYIESMQRKNLPIKYSKKYIYSIYDHFICKGKAEIVFISYKNIKIAGMVVLYSGKYIHMLFSGFSYKERNISASDILIDHFTMDKKFIFFDFLCSPKSDKGLIRFKKKWGSDEIIFRFYTKDLKKIPCFLWKILYEIVNTRIGAWITRLIRK